MTTDIVETVPSNTIDGYAKEYAAMSADSIRDELRRLLALSADNIKRMAALFRVAMNRGDQLDDFKEPVFRYLRRIAAGLMLPEILQQFADRSMLLAHVCEMPVREQERLLTEKTIPVVVSVSGDEVETVPLSPGEMTAPQIKLVFTPRGILTQDQQAAKIKSRQAVKPQKTDRHEPETVEVGDAKVDKVRGGVVLGRRFVPAADLAKSIAVLGGMPETIALDEQAETLIVQLSKEEHRQIRVMAAERKTRPSELMRQAAYAAGLIHQDVSR